jgi:protein SCO1/2
VTRTAIRAGIAAGLVALSACGGAAGGAGGRSPYRGIVLPKPIPKPAVTLTATDGRPYDFARETAGHLTFLFFGYTNCPDVCPVHMANLAAVMARLTPSERQDIRVVFVTTDPDRDSLPRLRAWLAAFDSSFVGLRGDTAQVARFERSVELPTAIRGPVTDSATGAYEVGHAAQVVAFSADDSAHVVYPFGTRQEDWAHDIPLLLYGPWHD